MQKSQSKKVERHENFPVWRHPSEIIVMSARSCAVCSLEEEPRDPLPQVIASRVEALRQERLRAFVDQAQKPGAPSERTGLESQVDELLDSLYNLHRLEQLAAHVAHGGQITVE